jgi:hypothetical protein
MNTGVHTGGIDEERQAQRRSAEQRELRQHCGERAFLFDIEHAASPESTCREATTARGTCVSAHVRRAAVGDLAPLRG